MELRHLRYFVAVAEELNVRRAALRLHVSQPPLSRQIHDLEAEIGARLFVRQKRGMQLTDAGRLFLGEARHILLRAQQAVQLAQSAGRGEAGHLSLAYTAWACDPVFPVATIERLVIRTFEEYRDAKVRSFVRNNFDNSTVQRTAAINRRAASFNVMHKTSGLHNN